MQKIFNLKKNNAAPVKAKTVNEIFFRMGRFFLIPNTVTFLDTVSENDIKCIISSFPYFN